MFIKDAIKIRRRSTGEAFDCFPQMVDLNFTGRYVLRYNIGINGYTEWTNLFCLYNDDDFNEQFEVISA